MSRNDDYTTGNLLDYLHHQNYYELVGIDLSRQTNMNIGILILQEIWKKIMVKQCFLLRKSSKKLFLNITLDSLISTE